MTLAEIWKRIESPEFIAHCEIASGLSLFTRIVQQDEVYDLLSLLYITDYLGEAAQEEVLTRIKYLGSTYTEPGYTNNWDTPIAVYLLCLQSISSPLFEQAKHIVLSLPNLFWAKAICHSNQ